MREKTSYWEMCALFRKASASPGQAGVRSNRQLWWPALMENPLY